MKESNEPKTLRMTMVKVFFDMINSGYKKEEYRQIKPYWESRFLTFSTAGGKFKQYDKIIISNGYGNSCPTIVVECLGITIQNKGEERWGWSERYGRCFVLKLGKILERKNFK
jgi:hypothetical protein